MTDSSAKGPIEFAIAGAPPALDVPRAYGWGVWAFAVGLLCIVGLLANVYYGDFGHSAMYGMVAVAGLLALCRLFREQLLALPTGLWVAVLALLAIAPRLALVLMLPYQSGEDFAVYHKAGVFMAQCWQLGEGFRCYYPPGQVFTLGVIYKITGNSIQAAQMFNALYAALTIVGLWYAARAMFGEFVGRLAGLLAVFLPSTVLGVMLIGAETPETFWLVLAVCMYVTAVERRQKLWAALLCGLALGVGALIRPQYMLLPAPLGLHMLISWSGRRRKALLSALAMGLGVAVVVLPWTIRNYFVTGGFVPLSSNSGQVLYSANCDDATGNYNQAASDRLFLAVEDACRRDRAERQRLHLPPKYVTGDVHLQRIGTQWALDWIARNPERFLDLSWDKFKFFWEKDHEIAWWVLTQPTIEHGDAIRTPVYWQDFGAGVSVGYYVAVVFAAAVGLLRFGRRLARNRAWMFFPIMAAYFTAVHMVFESQGKYHFMLVPLMCIFAALAASPAEAVAPADRQDVDTVSGASAT